MKEEAEAAKEIAIVTGKAIDASVKLGGIFRLIFGDAAIEFGGAVKDWATYFRYKNLLKIQDKVFKLHKKRNIEGKTILIPPRYAIPLIQNASQEDNDDIQSLWAGLVANSTDPDKKLNVKKIYIEILSSLEPIDVQIMLYFSKQGWLLFREVPGGGITIEKLSSELNLSEDDIVISLQNLHRLGCLVADFEPNMSNIGKSSFGTLVKSEKTSFRLSPLGYSLLEACECN
ncbi:MAG: DUF4393 domain-containing protein [Planctomycetes bacterium]|nr:DUF4393 domain-containing protein [Planctomycetota bacterium]